MLRGMGVLGIVALILCALAANAFCEEKKACESNCMELLAELLKAKGVISPDEAEALKSKITGGESRDGVKALVGLLKNKGLVSDGEADKFNQLLANKPTPSQEAAKAILIVPRDQAYVQKITENVVSEVKKDIHDQVQTVVAENAGQGFLPDKVAENLAWLQTLRFGGDVRLRVEPFYFPATNGLLLNPSSPNSTTQPFFNTNVDRLNEYLRLRLKVEGDINDKVTLGVRLATGDQTNPGSDNVIFGNYYTKNGFLLDQAYVRFRPGCGLDIWAGRMANPFLYTDLIYAYDLNLEGVAGAYKRDITSEITGYVTGGAFPLQEIALSSHDKWLFGGQAALEYKPDKEYSVKFGVALYDYENTVGMENSPGQNIYDYTAPLYMQKGNTVFNIDPIVAGVNSNYNYALASAFRDLDIIGIIDVACWDPVHVVLSGDFVKNVAFDAQKVSALSGRPVEDMQDYAYRAGLLVGYPAPRKFLQWNVFLYYKYVGTDSVVDAFDDQDFALGGTNAKGWILGAELGLMKNVWLTARWFTSDEISPFQNSTGPFSVDVFEFDTNVAF
ncbi:conserved exported hypothetical protein [Syntrophobacter sp. SbD1]|nr:conserved exported hypothetical protein [Syntrophobacter sp. SbD1]